MVSLLSPGVLVTERDLTTIVPAVATTAGAFCGAFQWGRVLERVLVENEVVLAREFGLPNDIVATHFFTCADFLSYGNNLNVVRVVGDSAVNASTSSLQTSEKFDGDGTTTTFTTTATFTGNNPTSENVRVIVDGLLQTESLDYTLNITASDEVEIVFNAGSIPATGTQNVEIQVFSRPIHNEDHFASQTNLVGSFFGKYPGEMANGLEVIATDSSNFSSLTADEQALFTSAPTGDEIHVAVIDSLGVFTGQAGTILEKFEFLSKTAGSLAEDGSVNYFVEKINQVSQFIWATGDLSDVSSTGKATLAGGISDDAVTSGQRQLGYDLFVNPDEIDIALVLAGEADASLISHLINNIAEVRKDCLVFCSPEKADVVGNPNNEVDDILSFRATLPSSSYGVMDCNWKYRYDKYNDVFRWIPLNGSVAGTVVFTDNQTDPWFSPAGFNRGQIKNVQKLAFNPSPAERDRLFVKNVNPVVSFQGEGVVLFGDKTMLSKPSAFDAINVRRLFIVLEKAISRASKFFLFEQNDEFTRKLFVNLVTPYLEDVKGRRGVYDFKVVADETNNTPEVIDRNEFVGDIYIKPTRAIRFIRLNFIATRTNVSFNEIVG